MSDEVANSAHKPPSRDIRDVHWMMNAFWASANRDAFIVSARPSRQIGAENSSQ
jgi:hypothetical protein